VNTKDIDYLCIIDPFSLHFSVALKILFFESELILHAASKVDNDRKKERIFKEYIFMVVDHKNLNFINYQYLIIRYIWGII
jgi:hypothetical protein